ncbi:MAG: DUF2079 domain-containing protein [Candidatus Levybacteria bacterium]|nr:DUF2079 domain-containing protein [Candidatus Levybacteria bacterium]
MAAFNFDLIKRNLFSLLKYLIGWPLSAVALFFVLRLVFAKAYEAIPNISNINYQFLFISIGCFFVYFFLRTYLWKYILGDKGERISYKKNALYWSTSELKRYVPGNIWSFLARTSFLEKENVSKKEVFSFLAFEAVMVTISSFLVSYFYIAFVLKNQTLNLLLLAFIAFCLLVFIFNTKLFDLVFKKTRLRSFFSFILLANAPFRNFKLLLLGVSTFFMLGLGTYFSAASLFYLDLKNILILVSLFTFSYFVGYISIITPMGLGVREGVITVGLSGFISSLSAAVISIFSRIVFIVSELLFLSFIVLWNKTRAVFIERVENIIFNKKFEAALAFFIILFILYFSLASFLRFDNFYTGRFDLGNMDQTVWNTLHGRIFQLTDPDGEYTISRLSIHADFILALISPLYLIWSHPKMLLLFQTVIVSLGSVFIYLIGNHVLKDKKLSFVFSVSYLLYPAVGFVTLYDFHAVALATTFLLATFYFYLKKDHLSFLIFALLAGSTKEEVWAIVAIFGLFIFLKEVFKKTGRNTKEILFGTGIFILGSTLFAALIWKIIPYFRGGNHFALEYYSQFGTSASEILQNIILNPLKTISTLTEGSRTYFLSQLLGPLGYLSLLAPIFLVFAVPDLFINLLSANPQLHQIYYQYSATITPFIFISAVYGARFILNRFKMLKSEYVAFYVILTTFVFLYFTGPLPGTLKPNIDMFTKQIENRVEITKFLSSIPKDIEVAATNNLGSYLSQRENIYTIPYGMDRADLLMFLVDHGWSPQSIQEQRKTIEALKQGKDFELVFETTDFFVFKPRN